MLENHANKQAQLYYGVFSELKNYRTNLYITWPIA